MSQKILFLSGLDFKDKSIQVIRKTPEAYVSAGWSVEYLVGRDSCPSGNYFYEKEINPVGMEVWRTSWPFANLRARSGRVIGLLLGKISSIVVVFKLAREARNRLMRGDVDVVYGYELQGVLAMQLVRLLGLTRRVKTVSRFQGTFLNEMFERKQWARILFNSDLCLAIWARSDLLLMTNDGTQGDRAVRKIRSGKGRILFWPNGVDDFQVDQRDLRDLSARVNPNKKKILLSVSRLVGWKRVDRCLLLCKKLQDKGFQDFKYVVVGEGGDRKRLEILSKELGIDDMVHFVGALPNAEVKNYLAFADIFLSMYDSSNVGNPLLEAMRSKKLIVTLNNGDTASWISHKTTGLIYSLDEDFINQAALDLLEIMSTPNELERMISNLGDFAKSNLWTWDERFLAEVNVVSNLSEANV